MYNQNYEEYMRNVLGYSFGNSNCCMTPNLYENNTYPCTTTNWNTSWNQEMNCECNLEEEFPEIYFIVNPMVSKICRENTRVITKELIEEMTETIYRTVEENMEEQNRNIETKDSRKTTELKNGDVRNPNVKKEENRSARPNNYLLRDLIKILILNQLLGRPQPPRPGPVRPPFPGVIPPAPPFPGGPGPVRPPRPQPRDYNDMVMF